MSFDCDQYGYIEPEIVEEAVYEQCNLGHRHVVKEAIYKIPEK